MRKHEGKKSIKIAKRVSLPIGFFIITLAAHIMIPFITYIQNYTVTLQQITSSLIIFFAGWSLMRLSGAIISQEVERLALDTTDNLRERTIITRIKYIKVIINIIIFVIVLALIIRQFESLKAVSTGMLASAGVAGLIVALSAQKVLGNILAGIQVAFTQPIRLDDVVVIEGEWGRIEEITATYVVLRIWDQRRLVLPISYFIENPIENWTKTTSEIMGTVSIFTDYTVPIDKIRVQLKKIVEKSPLWDQRVASLLATDTTEQTVKLRALVSARNSSDAWELRCLVREELITFIQQKYPHALPKTRVEMSNKK